MDCVLQVENLCKDYPKFKLQNVSFSIEKGSIMGFIGRNGAGKSTTLKSILNLVHPTSGEIRFFGMDMAQHEGEIKQRIGFAGGAVDYYKKKKISAIVAVTKQFYDTWDDAAYEKYMKLFNIDEDKTPGELSEGMKVKLNLVLALSHGAELLILDEPTSGLDPVSRDELMELFRGVVQSGERSILFSTHITSDLEKCASHITMIKDGEILRSDTCAGFLAHYRAQLGDASLSLEDILVRVERRNYDGKDFL